MSKKISRVQLSRLDQVITDYMQVHQIPGLAVGIVQGSEIVYKKGFGVKSLFSQEKIEEFSLFHMASIAKTFVGFAVMQLVSENKIQLDDFVMKHLPYFHLKDERDKEITIRHLVTHSSGLPNEPDLEWDKPQFDDEALERYVKGLGSKELLHQPGESFAYSDMAYDILGDVISKCSGVSFEEYMKVNVLKKLGMKDSSFLHTDLAKDHLTTPHLCYTSDSEEVRISEVFPYNRIHAPSSTLVSNVVDICNYLISYIQIEKEYREKLLDHSIKELWTPQIRTGWGGYQDEMGMGWFLGEYKEHQVRSHEGGDTGFRSYTMVFPVEEIGIVIMMNSDYVGYQNLCHVILDYVLDFEEDHGKRSLAHLISRWVISNKQQALELYNQLADSQKFYYVDEGEFLSLAHEWKKEKRWEDAIHILQFAKKLFPTSDSIVDRLEEVNRLKEQHKKV